MTSRVRSLSFPLFRSISVGSPSKVAAMLLAFDWHSEGVDRLPVSAHLEIKPGTMGEAGRADAANDRQRFDAIALMHDHGVEVRVERLPSPTVIEDNGVAIFLHDAPPKPLVRRWQRRPVYPAAPPSRPQRASSNSRSIGSRRIPKPVTRWTSSPDKWLSCFERRHFALSVKALRTPTLGGPDNSKEAMSEAAIHFNIACPTDVISKQLTLKNGRRRQSRLATTRGVLCRPQAPGAICPATGRRSASCCRCRCGAGRSS